MTSKHKCLSQKLYLFSVKKKKKSRSFQHTLDWVLNHMQYSHLFPATGMSWSWTDRRTSSFKNISVTESMFTFIEAPKRTRVFGDSCAVLQFCSCLFPTASLRLFFAELPRPDTSAKCAPHLLAHARTPPDLLLTLAAASPEEQQRGSPAAATEALGAARAARPALLAAGAVLHTPGGGRWHRAGRGAALGGEAARQRALRLPCPAVPALWALCALCPRCIRAPPALPRSARALPCSACPARSACDLPRLALPAA